MANQSIFAAFERMWQHVLAVVGNKANAEHSHDHLYYTELEVDTALEAKADADHNHDNAYDTKGSAENALASAQSYTDEQVGAIKMPDVSVYETKADAKIKYDEAQEYTNTKVSGLATTSAVATSISDHSTSTSAHSDIRVLINDLATAVSNFLDVDDETVDQLSEVLTLIENNRGTLESLTSTKVNVDDIINNLTTNIESKVLSAAQGVVIKGLIDALHEELTVGLDTIKEAKADWTQNDVGAIDYIKNRTHWVEVALETIVEETSESYASETVQGTWATVPPKISEGEAYIVTVDGVQYRCVAFSYQDSWYTSYIALGDTRIEVNEEGTPNPAHPEDVPFLVQYELADDGGSGMVWNHAFWFMYPDSNPHTIKIQKLSDNLTYHPLDEKFIPDSIARKEDITAHTNNKSNPHGVTLSQLGVTAAATELNYVDGVTSNVQAQLDAKANKSDIATTAMQGTATQNNTYWKIADFGNWGTGTWMAKGFSMLITSRAGEMVWVSLAANDSDTSAGAIRLINRYSKIAALHYSVAESAIYVTAAGWANNICAHILSNVNGDYVPTITSASALPSDATSINIVEFGVDSSNTVVGDESMTLKMGGSADRPTYNGADMALKSDVNTHTNNKSNPHGVSCAQIGALSTAGDTMTGKLAMNMSNPHLEMKDTAYDTKWYFQAYQDQLAFGPTFEKAVKTDKNGNMTVPGTVSVLGKFKLDYDSTNECINFVFT